MAARGNERTILRRKPTSAVPSRLLNRKSEFARNASVHQPERQSAPRSHGNKALHRRIVDGNGMNVVEMMYDGTATAPGRIMIKWKTGRPVFAQGCLSWITSSRYVVGTSDSAKTISLRARQDTPRRPANRPNKQSVWSGRTETFTTSDERANG